MRVDLLKRAVLNGGESLPLKLSQGHLNGVIIFSSRTQFKMTLTARRRASNKTHILANGLFVADLSRISEQDNGYGNGASLQINALMDYLQIHGALTAPEYNGIELTAGQRGLSMVYVDFGSLFLNSDNDLDLTLAALVGEGQSNVAIYRVSAVKRPDFMKVYDVVTDFDATHHQVDSLYYCSGGPKAMLDRAEDTGVLTESPVSFTIRDDDDVAIVDGLGALCGSSIFSNNSGLADQRIVRLYRKRDALPADVYVKVSGVLASAGYTGNYLVVVRLVYDLFTTSTNTIAEAEALTLRIGELERKDPQTAQALRHSGHIVKSEQMAAAVANVAP